MANHINDSGKGGSGNFFFVEPMRRRIQANRFFQVEALRIETSDDGSEVLVNLMTPAWSVCAGNAKGGTSKALLSFFVRGTDVFSSQAGPYLEVLSL